MLLPKGMKKALLFLTHVFRSFSFSTDSFPNVPNHTEEKASAERSEEADLGDGSDAATR